MDEKDKPIEKENTSPEKGSEVIEKKDKIATAKEIVERQEAANRKTEELLQRQEDLLAEQIVSGNADAGQEAKQETEEEKTEKEAKGILREVGLGE